MDELPVVVMLDTIKFENGVVVLQAKNGWIEAGFMGHVDGERIHSGLIWRPDNMCAWVDENDALKPVLKEAVKRWVGIARQIPEIMAAIVGSDPVDPCGGAGFVHWVDVVVPDGGMLRIDRRRQDEGMSYAISCGDFRWPEVIGPCVDDDDTPTAVVRAAAALDSPASQLVRQAFHKAQLNGGAIMVNGCECAAAACGRLPLL